MSDVDDLRAELATVKTELASVRADFEYFVTHGRIELMRDRRWRADQDRYQPLRDALASGGPEHALAVLLSRPQHHQLGLLGAFTEDELISVLSRADFRTRDRLTERMTPTRRQQVEIAANPDTVRGLCRVVCTTAAPTHPKREPFRSRETKISAKLAKAIESVLRESTTKLDGSSYIRSVVIGTYPRYWYAEQIQTLRAHCPGFCEAEEHGVLVVEPVSEAEAATLVVAGHVPPRTAPMPLVEPEAEQPERWAEIQSRVAGVSR